MAWQIGDILDVTKGARQAMPFIRGNVRAGVGATATYKMLQQAGMGARKQDVLDIHRAYTYAYTNPEVYLPSDPGLKPRTELIPLSPTSQKYRYHTTGFVDIFDDISGTVERRYMTLTSQSLIAANEIQDKLLEMGESEYNIGGVILHSGIESITYSDNPIYGADR